MRIADSNWKTPYSALVVEHDKTTAINNAQEAVANIINRGTVKSKSILHYYCTFLNSLLKKDLEKEIIVYPTRDEVIAGKGPYVNRDGIVATIKEMSSGQMHLFSLVNKVFEKIRFDALFVFDEPEVHLHPKMISEFFINSSLQSL